MHCGMDKDTAKVCERLVLDIPYVVHIKKPIGVVLGYQSIVAIPVLDLVLLERRDKLICMVCVL